MAKRAMDIDSYFASPGEDETGYQKRMWDIVIRNITQGRMEGSKTYMGKSFDELKNELTPQFSMEGKPLEQVIQEVFEKITPNSINLCHPKYLGHMITQPTLASQIAECIIGSTNQCLFVWEQSPAATLVEQSVVSWMCRAFGYNRNSDGVITSGGSAANEMALLVARNWYAATNFGRDVKKDGLLSDPNMGRLRIFTSDQSHVSVSKAASVLGLGEDSIIRVGSDDYFRMDVSELRRHILKEARRGNLPFCIVATAGTTNTGSVDPLSEIGEVAEEFGAWYHVDGAYGGAAVLSSTKRSLLDGIKKADSITWDPHKWLYQSFSCGAVLFKNGKNFKYLKSTAEYALRKEDEEKGILNLGSKSIQGSKRFDALKVWMSLKHLGLRNYGKIIDYTIELAEYMAGKLMEERDFEVATWPELNILCFRFAPQDLNSESMVNEINERIKEKLYFSGEGCLSLTKLDDKKYLRAVLLNVHTTWEDIDELIKTVRGIGSECLLAVSPSGSKL